MSDNLVDKVCDCKVSTVWFERFVTHDNLSVCNLWDLISILGEYCRRIDSDRKASVYFCGLDKDCVRAVEVSRVIGLLNEYILEKRDSAKKDIDNI